MTEPDTSTPEPQAASAEPTHARMQNPWAKAPWRWIFRGALFTICLTLVAVWRLLPTHSENSLVSEIDPERSLILAVVDGATYGQVDVFLGDPKNGQQLADDAAIRRTVGQQLKKKRAGNAITALVIQARGSIAYGELARVMEIARSAIPKGADIAFKLAMPEEP